MLVINLCLWFDADETSLTLNGKPAVHDVSLHRYPAAQLLDKADDYINSLDYDLARRFCQRALDAEKENTRALETLGFVELQSGDLEQARHVFFYCDNNCVIMLVSSAVRIVFFSFRIESNS